MKQLFFSECSRYKKSAAIFFVGMLMLFAYITSDRSPFPPSWKYDFINYMPTILALIFGLVQMYLHKRANHWAYLIHRPLDTRKIFLAVIGAGMTIVFIVTALPFLLVTAYLDLFTFQNIDLRDYVNIFSSLLRYHVFYLVSCLVIISVSKGTAAMYISFFMCLFTMTPANHLALFLPVSIFILVLLYLNAISFKPNIKSFIDKPTGVVLHSVCMMLGIFMVLLFATAVLHEIGGTAINGKAEAGASTGTMRYFALLTKPEDRLAYALEGSEHPNAEHYIKQAELAETGVLRQLGFKFPFRGQILHENGNTGASIRHASTNTVWDFSHDSMLLEGRNLATNDPAGVVGKRGFLTSDESVAEEDRFAEVPILTGNRILMTPKTLYYIDFEDQIFETKYQLQGDEKFVSPPTQRPYFWTLVTNQRLLLFDKQEFDSENSDISPEYSVPLPTRHKNVNEIQFYELVDGYLLQFMGMNFYGHEQPGVEVVHAKLSGEVEPIGRRAFNEFYVPAWRRQMEEILAPAMFYAAKSFEGWVQAEPQELGQRFQSLSVYWHMVILHLVSFVAVIIMCRVHRLNRKLTLTWIGLTGVFGLPALVSFFLLNPWIPLKRLFGAMPAKQGMGSGSHEPQSV